MSKLSTLRSKTDLTAVSATTTATDAYTLCKQVKLEGYRAACIPSKYIPDCRGKYKNIIISTVANYPLGLHGSNVTIREVQGVIGLCEDISKIEVDVLCPIDIRYNLDMFAELNHLIPIKFILDWNYYSFLINSIPENKFKYPVCTSLGIINPTYLKDPKSIKKRVDKLKDKGYTVKLYDGFNNIHTINKWVNKGVDIVGIQNTELLNERT